MMVEHKYVIGLDYGSDSCRALVVNATTGEELSSSVKLYPRWSKGLFCSPEENRYRQHPLDYLEVLVDSVTDALSKCPQGVAKNVVGMAFDTTGSTPVLIDELGIPLALRPEFAENPNAMFVLWKDHTAINEAAEINKLAREWDVNYTELEGGIYSSEWVWAKMLHVLRWDASLAKSAYSWVEHCDWLPGVVTGTSLPSSLKRSRCAAGHKAMWCDEWGGLPSEDFLTKLDPLLKGFRDRLFHDTYTSDTPVGKLTKEWADRLGLSTDVVVSIGAFDCHMGAVGAQIAPNTFVRVVGTSTCDIMVSSYNEMEGCIIPGICGQVDGSVLPEMVGLEAGQSAFGDVYAWFKRVLAWPIESVIASSALLDEATKVKLVEEAIDSIIPLIALEAEKVPAGSLSVFATDWMNGRRTPDANQLVKGTITGLTLATTAPQLFRALVEATAFGSKAIVDRFIENGIKIDSVIAIGGISQKSPLVMQILADVLNMPIKVAKCEQACALGAAMFAATAAGVYSSILDAQAAMGQGFSKVYSPNPHNAEVYKSCYNRYKLLGDTTEASFFSNQ